MKPGMRRAKRPTRPGYLQQPLSKAQRRRRNQNARKWAEEKENEEQKKWRKEADEKWQKVTDQLSKEKPSRPLEKR